MSFFYYFSFSILTKARSIHFHYNIYKITKNSLHIWKYLTWFFPPKNFLYFCLCVYFATQRKENLRKILIKMRTFNPNNLWFFVGLQLIWFYLYLHCCNNFPIKKLSLHETLSNLLMKNCVIIKVFSHLSNKPL